MCVFGFLLGVHTGVKVVRPVWFGAPLNDSEMMRGVLYHQEKSDVSSQHTYYDMPMPVISLANFSMLLSNTVLYGHHIHV